MLPRRVALSAVLLVSAFCLTACTPKAPLAATTPQDSVSTPAKASPTPAVSTAPPAAVPIPNAEIVSVSVAPSPEDTDPVLGTRRWGTRSSKVSGSLGHVVTNRLHSSVEATESSALNRQQSAELLDILRHSRGVFRLVERYGGNPYYAKYYVKAIDANEDMAGNNTPWVTATLRVDFASPEGLRGIEMRVYRTKIGWDTLDNTPYVASTQVSYVDSTGALSRDEGYPASHKPDGLTNIRFKN